MNQPRDALTADNEQLEACLDRLVDGEISDPERRELLKRLAQAPDGWRRCALAFLEGQAWREALGECGVGDIERPTSNVQRPTSNSSFDVGSWKLDVRSSALTAARRAWVWQPVWGATAAAACFVLAFGLGLLVHRFWLGTAAGDPVPNQQSAFPSRPTLAQDQAPPGRWGTVQFVVDGPGGVPREMELPAVEGPDPDDFFRSQPPLPPEIERELRRLGHRVETRRQFVPIPLQDGRRALFPVDNVEVRLFGGQGYQ